MSIVRACGSCLVALSLVAVVACATSVTSGDTPEPGAGDGGTTADGGGNSGKTLGPNALLLAMAVDTKGLTGAVFDGTSWKTHAFPSEGDKTYYQAWTAIAPDGTGMAVLGADDQKVRFALWRGGDEWSAFTDVPQQAPKFYTSGTLIYQNGLFVLGYGTATGPVLQVFDPKAATWSAPHKFEAPSFLSHVRFEKSATGTDEIYVAGLESGDAYGGSFKPTRDGTASVNLKIVGEGYDSFRAPPVLPDGSIVPVQMGFYEDGHTVALDYFVVGASERSSFGGCDLGFDVFVRGPVASLLCRGYQGAPMFGSNLTLKGSPATIAAADVKTALTGFEGAFSYLPGIGSDTSYVVGAMNKKATLVRDLEGPGEPFADADTSVGVSSGP